MGLRSEPMAYVQLYIPSELAHAATDELGSLGLVQFVDLNAETTAFQRTYAAQVARLDDMERILRFLDEQCAACCAPGVADDVDQAALHVRPIRIRSLDDMHRELVAVEQRLLRMDASAKALRSQLVALREHRDAARMAAAFFQDNIAPLPHNPPLDDPLKRHHHRHLDSEALLGFNYHTQDPDQAVDTLQKISTGFIAGVIAHDKMVVLERMLWRVLRGNVFTHYVELDQLVEDPVTGEKMRKDAFLAIAHGSAFLGKAKKIAELLGARIYDVDASQEKRDADLDSICNRIRDLDTVLHNTEVTLRTELVQISENLLCWIRSVHREKAIYHVMNFFNYDKTRNSLIAEGWCPKKGIAAIQYALHDISQKSSLNIPPILHEVPTSKTPPTYHKVNKYTQSFQSIIDAYGIAQYQEINPGLFTIITFPFLFAVMFGDFGHGILMTLFAVWFVHQERRLSRKPMSEMLKMIFDGRYTILLMGLFSIYTGLIYNDAFSMTIPLFQSGWKMVKEQHGSEIIEVGEQIGTYPFGIDPAWHDTDNSLIFMNSFKMKMSILLGVTHMLFGIVLNIYNYRFFNKRFGIVCETVPQLLFMSSIFGYLCILILYKWIVQWTYPPPGLLNTLIFMFLSPGQIKPGEELYAGQAAMQVFLLLVAFVCVPWMLAGKPYYLYQQHKRHLLQGYTNLPSARTDHSDDSHSNYGPFPEEGEETFQLGEIVMHQVIHTIEFCLGGISHTASYLRLWALSLAHAQLSDVLWNMTMKNAFRMGSFAVFAGFAIWFVLTVGILLLMEGLSAFLHALRLHWIEFNSKFYQANGIKFEPFEFDEEIKHVHNR